MQLQTDATPAAGDAKRARLSGIENDQAGLLTRHRREVPYLFRLPKNARYDKDSIRQDSLSRPLVEHRELDQV